MDELEDYKRRVRSKAIEVARDESLCREGLNRVLEELDLDPINAVYRVQGYVKIDYTVTVNQDDAPFEDDEAMQSYLEDEMESNLEISFGYGDNDWMLEDAADVQIERIYQSE